LDAYGVPATVSICGRAAERAPWLVQDALRRSHEVSAHGWRWEPHAHMREDEEREAIRRTIDAIKQAGGVAPIGWHTRSSRSPNTRRLLIEQGFLYDSDNYGDDLPELLPGFRRPYVVLPYAFDTNDMNFHQGTQRFVLGDSFSRYVMDAFDRLWKEGAEAPKMMSIGLHIRIIGRPGRIAALETVLQEMQARGSVWFARRDQIARHWSDRFGDQVIAVTERRA
jgi:peptidoglycan/xylan/chitin deacetylase (PgdA/CDA1 family)